MKNIITIQYTKSIHHTNGMVGSWTDWDLSEFGISQADKIGENLKKEISDKKYVMYSSDLMRAKHTAMIVADYLGITPIYTEVLRERNLGQAVGKSVEWLRNNMTEEKTIDDRMFYDAETIHEQYDNLLKFHEQIMKSDNENILIVSHGGTLSVFHAIWLGLDADMLNRCNLHGKAGGVSFMDIDIRGSKRITRLSDMSYSLI